MRASHLSEFEKSVSKLQSRASFQDSLPFTIEPKRLEEAKKNLRLISDAVDAVLESGPTPLVLQLATGARKIEIAILSARA